MTDPAKPMEQLFGRMVEQWKSGDDYSKPNLVTYNALLFGLSRSTDPSALDRAEFYFKQMKQDQGLKQTALLYNTLMSAQSKRNRPDRAEALISSSFLSKDELIAECCLLPREWMWKLYLYGPQTKSLQMKRNKLLLLLRITNTAALVLCLLFLLL
jgi:hypothetical protein